MTGVQTCALPISYSKGVRTRSGKQEFLVWVRFTGPCFEIHIIINDGANLRCDVPTGLPLLYLCPVLRIMLFFSPVQVASSGNQFPNTLFHLGPGQQEFPVRVAVVAGDGDALAVVVCPKAAVGDSVGIGAYAVFRFQEFGILLSAFLLLILDRKSVV